MEVFGKWTVIGLSHKDKYQRMVNVVCSCGYKKIVNYNNLKYGKSKSCNKGLCSSLYSEFIHKKNAKNLKIVWHGMRNRCYNKKSKHYKNYGGRNIFICSKWLDFRNFYKDMINGYTKGLTIERINNNKGYSKDNCEWITYKEQMKNKRTTLKIYYNGITDNITGWSKRINISYAALQHRINRGWSIKRALTEPQYK